MIIYVNILTHTHVHTHTRARARTHAQNPFYLYMLIIYEKFFTMNLMHVSAIISKINFSPDIHIA